mmetsp:Transcript_123/g.307  ORF Transcript_123/g.307 Transcript_123/m.307 type:complete len:84 (+) Transcript_123:642-893(+)
MMALPNARTVLKKQSHSILADMDMPTHPKEMTPKAETQANCNDRGCSISVKLFAKMGPKRHPIPTEEYISPMCFDFVTSSLSM